MLPTGTLEGRIAIAAITGGVEERRTEQKKRSYWNKEKSEPSAPNSA